MKLLIITLGNPFTPTMLYKENYIIKAASELGHEVRVIATQYLYIDGIERKVEAGEVINSDYTLIRYKFKKIGNKFINKKLRYLDGLDEDIINFCPDLIFYNCPQIHGITRLKKIKAAIPNVKIVFDFSTKYINSARNWISLNILHKIIYKRWIQKSLPYVDKVFYISQESRDFANEVYKIPFDLMEHNNLPGELISLDQKKKWRKEIVNKYKLPNDCIMFAHSGKMGRLKRTIEMLSTFSTIQNPSFRLLIIGSFSEDIKNDAFDLISKDDRIKYFGFLTGEELTKILAASDLYFQPGTISQTSQTAICCGCPIAFTKIPTNQELFNGNGFFIDNDIELLNVFNTISENPTVLNEMSKKSFELASNELDYRIIYQKILDACNINS